ncbi:MAG: hypothetical protein K9J81_02580 [Desulfohalobiaceae bacterium]|nr:hypothetical protein [Desulfohalobiaceae bacterium]
MLGPLAYALSTRDGLALPFLFSVAFSSCAGLSLYVPFRRQRVERMSHREGMGIILLSLAILPLLGVGGMQLYKAEVPGPVPDKLRPRIRDTALLLAIDGFPGSGLEFG